MRGGAIALVILVIVVLVVLSQTLYTLNEGEQAIITQFGRPVGGAVLKAGLHAKIPFIQKAHRYPYERAMLVAGATFVEVEGKEQLMNAISEKTAMLFGLPGHGAPGDGGRVFPGCFLPGSCLLMMTRLWLVQLPVIQIPPKQHLAGRPGLLL